MEEAAAASAAASSAPVADFDFDGQREGEDYDGLDGDVPDDIPCAAAEDVGIAAEPESEPDIESAARDDAAEPDVDVEVDDADGGTTESVAGLPVEAPRDVVPGFILEVRHTLERYMEKWARLLLGSDTNRCALAGPLAICVCVFWSDCRTLSDVT